MNSFKPVAAAVALFAALGAGNANADSYFWAVNQFTTIQKLDGDTGAVVEAFAVPFGSGGAASIAVVGNIGYYTLLGSAAVYKVDMTTHAALGTAFSIPTLSGYVNGITPDSAGHLWFAGGGADPMREFDTAGTLLSTHAFPTAANAYRDGSVVFGNFVVANRGDQQGPYDKYDLSGGNSALTVNQLSFIGAGNGSNGIAFNGVNFYTSDEQAHKVSKWDINGAFVSIASLDPGSRYENWTFASQDIVAGVPEPETYALMFGGLLAVGFAAKRKTKAALVA